jgi:hypothetical protein
MRPLLPNAVHSSHAVPADDRWWSAALLIPAVMLMTIFEGAFRKWVFASDPLLRYATYFSKDVLFVYAAYLGWRRNPYFDLSWVAVCAALILLPSMGATLMAMNPVAVILSFRAYLILPICAYLSAPLIRNFRDAERCAVVVAFAAIAVALLSMYQYTLPATHFLNRYDSGIEAGHIVAEAGHVRATGTFAYISGMAMMAGFSAWAGTFLALPLTGRPVWLRFLGACAIVAGFICSATSMSRGALMFWGITLVGGCLMYLRPKHVFTVVLAMLVVSPFITGEGDEDDVASGKPNDSLISGLAYRMEHADTVSQRAGYMINNLLFGILRHPLGEGLGRGQPGGAYAAGLSKASLGYESEWGRIAFEIGPIGLAAALFMRFNSFRLCWRQFRASIYDQNRLILASVLPFFGIISLGWMVFNHTGNSFAWTAIALGLSTVVHAPNSVRPDQVVCDTRK